MCSNRFHFRIVDIAPSLVVGAVLLLAAILTKTPLSDWLFCFGTSPLPCRSAIDTSTYCVIPGRLYMGVHTSSTYDTLWSLPVLESYIQYYLTSCDFFAVMKVSRELVGNFYYKEFLSFLSMPTRILIACGQSRLIASSTWAFFARQLTF